MSQLLSNPEYLHTLLNPLPVYGLALSALGLLVALIGRSGPARTTALVLIFVSAISAWPVYYYGERSYDRVLALADPDGEKWMAEHKRRGERLIYVFFAVAALSAMGIAAEVRFRRAAVPLAIFTLLLATIAVAAGSYISYAGGRIRHREFRFERPPAQERDQSFLRDRRVYSV